MIIQLAIAGILLCSLGSIISTRNIFKSEPPKVGTFLYTRDENEERQIRANKKYLINKRIDFIGLALSIIGIICQILAVYLGSTAQ